MLKKTVRLLPHAAILICNMYVVFFLIDRVNQAMNFIDNSLTKGLLSILCVISFFNARALLASGAKRSGGAQRRANAKAAARPGPRAASAAPRAQAAKPTAAGKAKAGAKPAAPARDRS